MPGYSITAAMILLLIISIIIEKGAKNAGE